MDWKKGSRCWRKYAPKIYYANLLFSNVILPGTNIVAFFGLGLVNGNDVFQSMYESWVVVYIVIQVAKLITYFVAIRNTWLKE